MRLFFGSRLALTMKAWALLPWAAQAPQPMGCPDVRSTTGVSPCGTTLDRVDGQYVDQSLRHHY